MYLWAHKKTTKRVFFFVKKWTKIPKFESLDLTNVHVL